MRVVVVGGTGFVGRAIVSAFKRIDAQITITRAPRLKFAGPNEGSIERAAFVEPLRGPDSNSYSGADLVVNAAGLATPGASHTDDLYGANTLLPALLYRTSIAAGAKRFLHISSAAVLGRTRLQDTWNYTPDTPYGASKALGELALRTLPNEGTELVIHRPTSVHGRDRSLTRSLQRVASSALSSYAGPEARHTPQVLVDNVAAAAVFLGTHHRTPKYPVLQPSEGLTTQTVLEILGCGRTPRCVPYNVAWTIVRTSARVPGAYVAAQARRLEMLWFGQNQSPGWLTQEGFEPPYGVDAWDALGRS